MSLQMDRSVHRSYTAYYFTHSIIYHYFYYKRVFCSAVESNKKLQEHLATEKVKPVTVSLRIRTGVRLQRSNEWLKSSVLSRRLKAISDGDVMTVACSTMVFVNC